MNIRVKIIEIEQKSKRKILKKSCFFKKINKSNKPPARLARNKREMIQIPNIRSERGSVTTDSIAIKSIIG